MVAKLSLTKFQVFSFLLTIAANLFLLFPPKILLSQTFKDVTSFAGVGLSDTVQSEGVSFVDYDGDGRVDLLVSNVGIPSVLFRNQGDGTFLDVTTSTGFNKPGNGGVFGDYDNDGDLDLFFDGYLFRSNGNGTFVDVTNQSGTGLGGFSVVFGDYDLDGFIDIFSARFGGSILYHNERNGTFTNRATSAGLFQTQASNNVIFFDYDNDDDVDLYISKGEAPPPNDVNVLYQNDGDGTFTNKTAFAAVADTGDGRGVASGDYDNDGDLDLLIGSLQSTVLYRNNGDGTFTDVTSTAGAFINKNCHTPIFGDFDNDGFLDIYFVNNDGSNDFLANNRNGTFTNNTTLAGIGDNTEGVGGATGDFDNDGDLDIYVSNRGQGNVLFQNNGNSNNWLIITARGKDLNKDGIGTRIRVVAGSLSQIREISGGSGSGSQNSLRSHFGLGSNTNVDSIIVKWPGRGQQILTNISSNQFLTIIEGIDLQSDSLALVDLYNSTDGANWTDNSNWLLGPVSNWLGVTIAENRVTEIRLGNNSLTGALLSGLQNLTNLRVLDLSENQLSGEISEEFGNLSNLEQLNLSTNQFTGEIPASFGNLSNLVFLNLSSNPISGVLPPSFANLVQLRQLFLNGNQLTGGFPTEILNLKNLIGLEIANNPLGGIIPSEIGELTNLQFLLINGNDFSGTIPVEISNLINLTLLSLGYNKLDGSIPSELGNLINLVTLNLEQNRLSGNIPPEIGNLVNLQEFFLFENDLSGSIPATMGNLVNLQKLDFSDNQLSGFIPTEIDSMLSLTNLFLNKNEFTGTIPIEIGNLSNLTHLNVSENRLTGGIPKEIGNLLQLGILELNANLLTGPIPSELGNLSNLNELRLQQNQLNGAIPVEVGNLTNLKKLFLQQNQLTDAIPSEIGNLTALEKLHLHANQLSGAIPNEIKNLTKLTELLLNDNQLTGSIPVGIGALSELNLLDLSHNLFTGAIPASIGALNKLLTLNLSDNQLSGSLPSQIGNITPLQALQLNNNRLNGTIPPEIGVLTNLSELFLHENQLTGAVPAQLTNLTQLQDLLLTGNRLIDLPNLNPLSNLDTLLVQDNRFTFEDIEPNLGVAKQTFVYAPQDSVGTEIDTTAASSVPFTLSVDVGGANNQYLWLKDGAPISGANARVFTNNSMNFSDTGAYVCRITNTLATDLILFTRPINATVENLPPAAPQNLSVVPGDETATLQWALNTETDILRYRIYGDTSPNPTAVIDSIGGIASTTKLVTGLTNGITYFFRITAVDTALLESDFSDEVSATPSFDTVPPNIQHTPTFSALSAQDILITANISDDRNFVDAELNFRRGGEVNFTAISMTGNGNQFQATIPTSSVTSRGLEYFIAASDSGGNTTTEPGNGKFVIQVTVAEPGAVKNSPQPGGGAQTAYRIISVPMNLADKDPAAVLQDDFGPFEITKWRFFEVRANQSRVEFPNTSDMTPGKGFWLIVRDQGKIIDTGAGISISTAVELAIPLHSQWNLIGNPFDFAIPVNNLRLASGQPVELRNFNGNWNNPLNAPVTVLQPFEGHAIFNNASGTDTLFLNPDLSAANSISLNKGAGESSELSWSINILAQSQNASDKDNILGVDDRSEPAWDNLDRPEPPVIGEFVSVYFPHPEWGELSKNYCTDFHPAISGGKIWEFEIKTNIRDAINLTFDGLPEVPDEYEVWLVDPILDASQDLRQNARYLIAASVEHPKRLQLLIGQADFIDENIITTRSIPLDFELSQNFPNPFNPTTTIRYGLPREERVTLRIYNILGEEVVTLVNDEMKTAGFHVAVWDGRNRDGRLVGSGLYFYHLKAGGRILARKMALVR